MKPIPGQDSELEPKKPAPLMDVWIRAVLIGGLAVLCYVVFAPFLTLMVWSTILAVTIYPLHQRLTRTLGGRKRLASTILVVVAILLIIGPTALLMNSFADTVRNFIRSAQQNTLVVPAPRQAVQQVPIVGKKIYDAWSHASSDLPGFIQSLQPKIGDLARRALSIVASIGAGVLLFLGSFIVAGILMAYGESGARTSLAMFTRVAGPIRGPALAKLSTATIRTVALGVIGVAFIQAIAIGLALLIARVPGAGLLSIFALILCIAQLPAVVITLPAVGYIWMSGNYSHTAAITYTVILLLTGVIDNVLKPLMLGRGVDVPMPVILFGALGGMASGGILGMFVGATALALGYSIFMHWVVTERQ